MHIFFSARFHAKWSPIYKFIFLFRPSTYKQTHTHTHRHRKNGWENKTGAKMNKEKKEPSFSLSYEISSNFIWVNVTAFCSPQFSCVFFMEPLSVFLPLSVPLHAGNNVHITLGIWVFSFSYFCISSERFFLVALPVLSYK